MRQYFLTKIFFRPPSYINMRISHSVLILCFILMGTISTFVGGEGEFDYDEEFSENFKNSNSSHVSVSRPDFETDFDENEENFDKIIQRQWIVKHRHKHRETCITRDPLFTCAPGFVTEGAVTRPKVVVYCARKPKGHHGKGVFNPKANSSDDQSRTNQLYAVIEVARQEINRGKLFTEFDGLKKRKIEILVPLLCVKISDKIPRPRPPRPPPTPPLSVSELNKRHLNLKQKIFDSPTDPTGQACITSAPVPVCRRGFLGKKITDVKVSAYCGPRERTVPDRPTTIELAREHLVRGQRVDNFEGMTFSKRVSVQIPDECIKIDQSQSGFKE